LNGGVTAILPAQVGHVEQLKEPIRHIRPPVAVETEFLRFDGAHVELFRRQLLRDPFHLRPVGGGFFADDDVSDRGGSGAVGGKNLAKAVLHPARAANDGVAERAVGLVEPRGQPDAAGNGVQFGDLEMGGTVGAVVLHQDVWPDNSRHVGLEAVVPRGFDERGRFPGVEIVSDPSRQCPAHAEAVEQVAGAVEGEQLRAERLELRGERGRNRKRAGCDAPFRSREQSAFRHCRGNGARAVERGLC